MTDIKNDLGQVVLDHIAIAVKSIEHSQKIYEDIGFTFWDKKEIVASQKVMTAFANIDTHAHVELLQPTEEQGAIFDFINKRGEGIHHIAFLVPDIYAKQEELKLKGYKLLYETPQPGANNKLINFIHPKSAGGVMIEISQESVQEKKSNE
ncbi:MAG: methylmalonyl-CoA epimerase [Bacteriovoracaceae bacterium]